MTRTSPSTEAAAPSTENNSSQYVQFLFMKVDPAFYALLPNEKVVARQEFLSFLDKYNEKLTIVPYSMLGLRADCDILFWRISDSLELLEEMSLRMRAIGMGKYLRPVHSFLTVASPPIYASVQRPDESRSVVPGRTKYLFIYPFSKNREWYLLTDEQRREIMDDHLKIAKRHPGIHRNREYLLGLDETDFVAAYECDDPELFVRFLHDLRGSKASTYTPKATPLFACIRKDLGLLVESVG